MYLSLCFADTSIPKILSLLPIPRSILLPVLLFTHPVIIHLRDLVTCCVALMYSHRVGPECHIRHADEKIPLLVYMPQPTPLENPIDTFFSDPITV
jgi:hypothetical protein